MEKIIQAAIQGTDGGMDPKGDCDECTDEEIRKAVEYMLSVVESRCFSGEFICRILKNTLTWMIKSRE